MNDACASFRTALLTSYTDGMSRESRRGKALLLPRWVSPHGHGPGAAQRLVNAGQRADLATRPYSELLCSN